MSGPKPLPRGAQGHSDGGAQELLQEPEQYGFQNVHDRCRLGWNAQSLPSRPGPFLLGFFRAGHDRADVQGEATYPLVILTTPKRF